MNNTDNRPIGIFDSGVGGLTVARSVRKELPFEDIIYFGDTARVPYGNKSAKTVTRFSKEIMGFMKDRNVKMVIAACNTASSFSLGPIKKSYDIPVLGVITPGVIEALRVSPGRRIGVIGTNSTISSGAYQKTIKKMAKGPYRLYSKSCPLFVPLVENGFEDDAITYDIAEKYLGCFKIKKVDTLILGCTHYPVLKRVISKVMGDVRLVDSSVAVAKEAARLLEKKGLRSGKGKRASRMRCFVSDEPDTFRKISRMFLGEVTYVKKAVP